ncbi:MAG: RNA-binding protein [Acidobacteriota bacterium]|nr:RNA-binding protein [Acidobacteriota bacterium]
MKLFVGNLSWNTAEEDLRDAFSRFGQIDECRIITDRDTGRSRGFGFITYADPDSAQAAMNEMNGSELDGRSLNVNEAKERAPRRDRDRGNRW